MMKCIALQNDFLHAITKDLLRVGASIFRNDFIFTVVDIPAVDSRREGHHSPSVPANPVEAPAEAIQDQDTCLRYTEIRESFVCVNSSLPVHVFASRSRRIS